MQMLPHIYALFLHSSFAVEANVRWTHFPDLFVPIDGPTMYAVISKPFLASPLQRRRGDRCSSLVVEMSLHPALLCALRFLVGSPSQSHVLCSQFKMIVELALRIFVSRPESSNSRASDLDHPQVRLSSSTSSMAWISVLRRRPLEFTSSGRGTRESVMGWVIAFDNTSIPSSRRTNSGFGLWDG
ncbi:hypothetical protein SCHPADRAFT_527104 [Schizopora paradoxa]|uniref:Uncharacterized protein n=1 Tax=Schizopora paradoxa TaxID=27342 RepID=A0A0H2REI3_9AGAM|nr:hypothetical protein SCHPADRAFT_527104 [Schizopora paradoxa]